MSQQIVGRSRFCILVLYCIFIVTSVFSSCGEAKDDNRVLEPDESVKELKITIVSGNRQTGVIGNPLPDSLVVFVSDKNNIGEPAWKVNFRIIFGEGTLSPAQNITDVQGFTATTLTPSGLPGEIQVEATPYFSNQSVIFTATSTAE